MKSIAAPKVPLERVTNRSAVFLGLFGEEEVQDCLSAGPEL